MNTNKLGYYWKFDRICHLLMNKHNRDFNAKITSLNTFVLIESIGPIFSTIIYNLYVQNFDL